MIASQKKSPSSLWPLAIIATFLVVFAAGGTTIYLALSSDPGSVEGAYTKALEFDKRQADLKTAIELGLSVVATSEGVKVSLPGNYQSASITAISANHKEEDFSSAPLLRTGNDYSISKHLSAGTWFITLKFDALEFSLTRFIAAS